jgi:hypothetical protein
MLPHCVAMCRWLPIFNAVDPALVQIDSSSSQEAGTDGSRLKIINIATAVTKRIHNLFNLIEKDILSTVHKQNMQIAPYSAVYTMVQ